MSRIVAVLGLLALVAAPVAASDLPKVYNGATPYVAAQQPAPATPPAGQGPQVINFPSGTDGTKAAPAPAPAGPRATSAPPAVMYVPSEYSIMSTGVAAPFAGSFGNYGYSPSMGGGFYDSGLFGGGGYYGAGLGYFGASPPGGYFYSYSPSAVLYRDILTTPLGKSVRYEPSGMAYMNPPGGVGLVVGMAVR